MRITSSAGLDDDDLGFVQQRWTFLCFQVFINVINGEYVLFFVIHTSQIPVTVSLNQSDKITLLIYTNMRKCVVFLNQKYLSSEVCVFHHLLSQLFKLFLHVLLVYICSISVFSSINVMLVISMVTRLLMESKKWKFKRKKLNEVERKSIVIIYRKNVLYIEDFS